MKKKYIILINKKCILNYKMCTSDSDNLQASREGFVGLCFLLSAKVLQMARIFKGPAKVEDIPCKCIVIMMIGQHYLSTLIALSLSHTHTHSNSCSLLVLYIMCYRIVIKAKRNTKEMKGLFGTLTDLPSYKTYLHYLHIWSQCD